MSIHVGGRRQKLFLVESRPVPKVAAMIRCVESTDFPVAVAQVTEPNVDTAGKDAPLSGQEGI